MGIALVVETVEGSLCLNDFASLFRQGYVRFPEGFSQISAKSEVVATS
jgi:hypothetical protein